LRFWSGANRLPKKNAACAPRCACFSTAAALVEAQALDGAIPAAQNNNLAAGPGLR
jgi:hypothetical protein